MDLTSSGVRNIDKRVFWDSRDIKTVTFPGTLETIGEGAFMNCILLQEVDLSHTRVRSIEKKAFRVCHSLQTVTFPSTLETIGKHPFYNCHMLTEVDLSHTMVRSIESIAFSSNTNFRTVRFPNTLKTIEENAFKHLNGPLGELTISDGVLIAPTAFSGCTLVRVVFFVGLDGQIQNLPPISRMTFVRSETVSLYGQVTRPLPPWD